MDCKILFSSFCCSYSLKKGKSLTYVYLLSYLYPDGRSIDIDLSWAVTDTPEDHVQVCVCKVNFVGTWFFQYFL